VLYVLSAHFIKRILYLILVKCIGSRMLRRVQVYTRHCCMGIRCGRHPTSRQQSTWVAWVTCVWTVRGLRRLSPAVVRHVVCSLRSAQMFSRLRRRRLSCACLATPARRPSGHRPWTATPHRGLCSSGHKC